MLPVLRHDALRTKAAGVREDGRAVALKVLAVLDPGRSLGEEFGEPALTLLEGRGPPVRAVQLESKA
jgi:hypothetical protein